MPTNTKQKKYKNSLVKKYKPYKGFYDLREYDLPKKVFQRLWNIQDMLNFMSERQDYYKEFLKTQWEDAKEISARYQQELFSYEHLPPLQKETLENTN